MRRHEVDVVIREGVVVFIFCFFFLAYLTLSLVKHHHFWSGYDLALVHQAVWRYSVFQEPITTIHAYTHTSLLHDHLELIYLVFAPIYWAIPDARVLLVLQVVAVIASGIAVYRIAMLKHIRWSIRVSIVISYFMFYGAQQAIWNDVHSVVFGVSFLSWFLYGLLSGRRRLAILSFILAIFSKEDIAFSALLISFVIFLYEKKRITVFYLIASLLYAGVVFGIYFPKFTPGYRYDSDQGVLSNLRLSYIADTEEKRDVWRYSFAWFGFLPIFMPIHTLVAVGDLAKYFVIANDTVRSSHGLFGHYRFSLGLFLVWSVIECVARYRLFHRRIFAVALLTLALLFQYHLHLPLSYLSKQWFWTPPSSASTIRDAIRFLPRDASVATQVNILPHIAHRDRIYTLWPTKRSFDIVSSPCESSVCEWIEWRGDVDYVLVDTSSDWDIRHLLAQREEFIQGIRNLVRVGILEAIYTNGETAVYRVKR